MKCRVGLLQQSRPFSTVYSKREAALESSLHSRGVSLRQPSLKAGRPAADGRQALKLFLLGHLPLSLSRGEYIGSFRLRWLPTQCGSPLGNWKAHLGLLTLPIKPAGIERLLGFYEALPSFLTADCLTKERKLFYRTSKIHLKGRKT